MGDVPEGQNVPDPMDVHVGKRIWDRRREVGMSRRELGEVLGIGLKQVNKYETAANRVSASRLHGIAKVLDVPVMFFFDDYEKHGEFHTGSGITVHTGTTAETRALIKAYHAIPDGPRQRFLRLARSIADSEDY